MGTATLVRAEEDRVTETEPLRRFDDTFEFETYCLELWCNEDLTTAIREAAEKKLEEKPRAFDGMLARHPATLAENARRRWARRLERERLERIEARERWRIRAALGYLARKWNARLERKAQ